MRQVAIAFAVTGPSAKNGHRISELAAVEQADGRPSGRKLHFVYRTDDTQTNGATFAAQFGALDELVGEAPIVVLNAGRWRQFLRVELASVKKRGARRLLTQTIDVGAWAHQRFPRQRKDVVAIARRLEIAMPQLAGLELEAELLRLIAAKMSPVVPAVQNAELTPQPAVASAPRVQPEQRRLAHRIHQFWRNVIGRE